jgi:hypothetical protein
MKHIKLFENIDLFQNWKDSEEYVTPNVSFVESEGSITYVPKSENLICVFNITEPGETRISNNIDNISSIIVDGIVIDPIKEYNFEEVGDHTIEYVLIDKTLIGDDMLYFCENISAITIPKSVTRIGSWAIEQENITSIIVSKNNPVFDSRDNCNAIIETETNTLVLGCKNSIIPSSVTRIGYRAFRGISKMTMPTIPTSVTYIGDEAFSYCNKGITSINIPDSVTYIGNNAFSSCSAATTLTLPDSVTYIGNNAFNGCKIKSITLPDSVTHIGDGAFYGNKITSISIPDSITHIGYNTFRSCESLSSIKWGKGVTSIGTYAFYFCNFTSITIPDSVTSIGNGAFWGNKITSINIPDSVTQIGYDAFYGNIIESVTIPASVTQLGVRAFDLRYLKYITVAQNHPVYDTRDNCNAIIETETNTLVLGSTNTIIPDSVTSLGDSAFAGSSMESIIIPASVTRIGSNAFIDCDNLTSITCLSKTAPQLSGVYIFDVNSKGVLRYPKGSNYSAWIKELPSGWTTEEIE